MHVRACSSSPLPDPGGVQKRLFDPLVEQPLALRRAALVQKSSQRMSPSCIIRRPLEIQATSGMVERKPSVTGGRRQTSGDVQLLLLQRSGSASCLRGSGEALSSAHTDPTEVGKQGSKPQNQRGRPGQLPHPVPSLWPTVHVLVHVCKPLCVTIQKLSSLFLV